MYEYLSPDRQSMLTRMESKLQKNPSNLDPWLMGLTTDLANLPAAGWRMSLFRNLHKLPAKYQDKGEQIKEVAASLMGIPGYTVELAVVASIKH